VRRYRSRNDKRLDLTNESDDRERESWKAPLMSLNYPTPAKAEQGRGS
jgi:hypothetical protein